MLVDRLRTLGATNRIDKDVVAETLHADDVAHHAVDDAQLFVCPDPTGQADDAPADDDIYVVGIERQLLIEGVANLGAQLVVAEIVGVSNVFVILFHASSGSAQGGSGYRKNSSDAPIVRARLFFQNERAWLPVTAAVPPVGVR